MMKKSLLWIVSITAFTQGMEKPSPQTRSVPTLRELCFKPITQNFERSLMHVDALPRELITDIKNTTTAKKIFNMFFSPLKTSIKNLEFAEEVKRVVWNSNFSHLAALLISRVSIWNRSTETIIDISCRYPHLLSWKTDTACIALPNSRNRGVDIWNIDNQSHLHATVPTALAVSALAWNPIQTNLLAIGQTDGTILLYDYEKNSTITLKKLSSRIHELCWANEGECLYSVRQRNIDCITLKGQLCSQATFEKPQSIQHISYGKTNDTLAFLMNGVISYIKQGRIIRSQEKTFEPPTSLSMNKHLLLSTQTLVYLSDPINKTLANVTSGKNIINSTWFDDTKAIIVEKPYEEEPKKVIISLIETKPHCLLESITLQDLKCLYYLYKRYESHSSTDTLKLVDTGAPEISSLNSAVKSYLIQNKFLIDTTNQKSKKETLLGRGLNFLVKLVD